MNPYLQRGITIEGIAAQAWHLGRRSHNFCRYGNGIEERVRHQGFSLGYISLSCACRACRFARFKTRPLRRLKVINVPSKLMKLERGTDPVDSATVLLNS